MLLFLNRHRVTVLKPTSCYWSLTVIVFRWQKLIRLIKMMFSVISSFHIASIHIVRFELLFEHYISWKFFWQISYRKDTLLKDVSNSCADAGSQTRTTLEFLKRFNERIYIRAHPIFPFSQFFGRRKLYLKLYMWNYICGLIFVDFGYVVSKYLE